MDPMNPGVNWTTIVINHRRNIKGYAFMLLVSSLKNKIALGLVSVGDMCRYAGMEPNACHCNY